MSGPGGDALGEGLRARRIGDLEEEGLLGLPALARDEAQRDLAGEPGPDVVLEVERPARGAREEGEQLIGEGREAVGEGRRLGELVGLLVDVGVRVGERVAGDDLGRVVLRRALVAGRERARQVRHGGEPDERRHRRDGDHGGDPAPVGEGEAKPERSQPVPDRDQAPADPLEAAADDVERVAQEVPDPPGRSTEAAAQGRFGTGVLPALLLPAAAAEREPARLSTRAARRLVRDASLRRERIRSRMRSPEGSFRRGSLATPALYLRRVPGAPAPLARHEVDHQGHALHAVALAHLVFEEVGPVAADDSAIVHLDREPRR